MIRYPKGMSQLIHAIFEDGVLKPLEPLALAEHQRVWLSIGTSPIDESDAAGMQRKAMEELDAEMDVLPDQSPDDGFTAANHDRVLYGGST
jgi:predicted DNA-binding antitoxin AbrB/MazE fold protein